MALDPKKSWSVSGSYMYNYREISKYIYVYIDKQENRRGRKKHLRKYSNDNDKNNVYS